MRSLQSDWKISPRYFVSRWASLNLNQNESPDWQIAVDIFEDRMMGRFFRQIEMLEMNPDKRTRIEAGISIMAIECLLIENLEQFFKGIKQTNGQGNKMFHDFFARSPKLGAFFNTRTKTTIFYNYIRCGILHQGEAKFKSVIHTSNCYPIAQWVNNANPMEGILLHRRRFHAAVVRIFRDYIRELRGGKNAGLRLHFRRKMDFIANSERF